MRRRRRPLARRWWRCAARSPCPPQGGASRATPRNGCRGGAAGVVDRALPVARTWTPAPCRPT
ncbi:hypothetical protein QJS66_15730 [Kocuria rhizophila]|nr:hypothetical protein QJS66_15730 [Kocuria rhizophila]